MVVNWNLNLSQEVFFSQSDSSYFEMLKIILIGSCTEMLDVTNFWKCFGHFDAKILKNTELTWSKSIKLNLCCDEEWHWTYMVKVNKAKFVLQWEIARVKSHFFDKSLPVITFFNWYCLFVKEALRDWLLTQKFIKLSCSIPVSTP